MKQIKINNNDRPENWKDFFGQTKIINNLKVIIESSIKENKQIDHILIHGGSGMGKTSLAILISKVANKKIHILNVSALQKPSDLIAVLTTIKEGEFIFIDEINAVEKELIETLYPVLEDGYINLIIGKEYNSKIVHVKLPSFTMITASTEITKIAKPFLNRFPIHVQLEPYNIENITCIIQNKAYKTEININPNECSYLALYARKTPRIAISLMNRLFDYFVVKKISDFSKNSIDVVLNNLDIHKFGLTNIDMNYLNLLMKRQPLGLETLSQIMNLPFATISNNIEHS
ncbi:AAA family ATPase [Spiroplasma endosymbiont of Labia minor]|uniref:AAA family ATPase n=1 Tax=Spiroplasma endosymbiont of Labia minor TaxID=3066305 RepID=UPI0030D51C78